MDAAQTFLFDLQGFVVVKNALTEWVAASYPTLLDPTPLTRRSVAAGWQGAAA